VEEADLGPLWESLIGAIRAPGTERKLAGGELVFFEEGRKARSESSSGSRNGVLAPFLGPTGSLLGALYLDWSGGEPRDAELLPLYVAHAAAAMEAAMASDRLRTDPATGLPTPAAAHAALVAALERAQREGLPLAVVVVHVPGLDSVRLSDGFRAAAVRLREIAATLQRAVQDLRADAWVARAEGDALVAVLPASDGSEARRVDLVPGLHAGLAIHPADGRDAERLLWTAARRAAKEARNT
jgi:hypothetical protein